MRERGFVIGVDTGGTFTDVTLLTPAGDLVMGKAPTTPRDFASGVMSGVGEVARQMELPLGELLSRTAVFTHGTTVATNALITRTGAKVGIITTRGFEDTTLIMRAIGRVDGLAESEVRHVTAVTKPEPIVPRERIRGVRERLDPKGEVLIPLHMEDVDAAVDDLARVQKCDAIAVTLLHSWADPVHEDAIRARVRERGWDKGVYWSFGSDLARVAGEYARANTAVLNSFVGATVERYLGDLEQRLRSSGLAGTFLVMQGNGGVVRRDHSIPIGSLQSGPAGGLISSAFMAGLLGHRKVLTTDMGGTSFDVSLVVDGTWPYAEEPVFERFRILSPISQIESIGAGGGTIARVDPTTGRLLVGPQSAGASPGPVAYDEGGEEVTVTDCDLVLGYIDPEYFLGGRKRLVKEKAERAILERIARPLGLGVVEAAAGVYRIVNSVMADLIRQQVVRSGHLPEEFVLYAFGGAGPVHAAEFARELGIGDIYVFPTSAVFSAFGAATADVVHSRVVTFEAVLPFEARALNDRLDATEAELSALMRDEGFGPEHVRVRRSVSMRFRRQTYGVEVPLPWDRLDDARVAELGRIFERQYEELYGAGTAFTRAGIEVYALRVDAIGAVTKPHLARASLGATDPSAARKGSRQAYFGGGFVETAVYERDRLAPGARVDGPAIVESVLTTVVIPPGHHAEIDAFRDLVLRAS
ncbi:MAG TPA: hydantoinase/oxoprolinase family protein [Gaiellaceae bacterium]|nr:hydantoinase/oxoprolinase family protein [Gaiellaceae bacterium]